ncbi:ROK family transcriptional regulator [Streptomyces beijiangensis]|uniref:ROK family transcriptional regulator n=1 Tax=Streptomyces beijiangensis TaxID=163361 RepID=A0A939JCY0_9ACTN|nr:ROK family transcriptional regulator [Streptomyces beijiangensis]MBO0511456.1 ROK family transcriptional regulator [Streptomyces beijiangensis]
MTDLRAATPMYAASAGPSRSRDRGSIRRTNLGVVLRILRDSGPRSRAQIAVDTGLPKPTVTTLVAELVAHGLISEGSAQREGAVGRPGTLVRIDGRGLCGIGVEISTSYVQVLALTLSGDTVHQHRVAVAVAEAGEEEVLDLTAQAIRASLTALGRDGIRPVGLTLAVPGVIDTAAGTVEYASAIGWRGVAVADGLRRRLEQRLPRLAVENDAKLGALAEYVQAQGSDVHDMVCITGERGIGAGIISDGRLLRGSTGFAGEVGHMPLDPERRPCACGRRGCWEAMVGLDAILRLAAADDDWIHDPAVELESRLEELRRRALDGDARTREALARVAEDLGLGVALLADVLNPRVVVLGGYFTHIGQLMLDRVREVVRERVMAPDAGGCEVRLSELGFAAAARGGAYLALDAVYQDPARFEEFGEAVRQSAST